MRPTDQELIAARRLNACQQYENSTDGKPNTRKREKFVDETKRVYLGDGVSGVEIPSSSSSSLDATEKAMP